MTYVSNIADSILSHTPEPGALGPEFYTAIAEWEKSEIPVAIVLISIDEVCRRRNGGGPPVEIIQDAVIRNFQTWLVHGSKAASMAA